MSRKIRITVELPEGYEDVHVDLCVADMNIHPDFIITKVEEVK